MRFGSFPSGAMLARFGFVSLKIRDLADVAQLLIGAHSLRKGDVHRFNPGHQRLGILSFC